MPGLDVEGKGAGPRDSGGGQVAEQALALQLTNEIHTSAKCGECVGGCGVVHVYERTQSPGDDAISEIFSEVVVLACSRPPLVCTTVSKIAKDANFS